MANEDIKNLIHHLNDMYKALGVMQSSLNDIQKYISIDDYTFISRSLIKIDERIEAIGADVYYSYLKRISKI